MDQQEQNTTATQAGAEKSAAVQLKEVTNQIDDFEAQKLGQLKTELEAFVKKQEALVKDYEKQYPKLKERWEEQRTSIQKLKDQLTCQYPPDEEPWKGHIEKCICAERRTVTDLKKRVTRRKELCQGLLQRKRDIAKERYDRAKAYLDMLLGLVQQLDGALAATGKRITEIQSLPTAESLVALDLFWFKLLPDHTKLAPETEGGSTVEGPTPEELCAGADASASEQPDEADVEEANAEKADEGRGLKLVDPSTFQTKLDKAWSKMRDAKTAYGKAEAEYKAEPDDLTSLEKQLDEAVKSLDEKIRKCLKEQKLCEDKKKDQKGSEA